MAASPLRVLAVIEAANVSGPVKNLLQFAEWARANSGDPVEIRLATYVRGPKGSSNAFVDAVRALNLPLDIIPEARRFDPSVMAGLKETISRYRPDILQTHNVKTSLFVRMTGVYRERPWVAFHHGYTATSRMDGLYNRLHRCSVPHAARVVTVCWPFVEQMTRIGVDESRISVLHNTAKPFVSESPEARAKLREELGVGPAGVMLLCVGRLSREKAQADLLTAFASVSARLPEVRLVLVGDGPELAALTALAGTLGISDRVRFAGHRSNVARYYGAADMFVLPSHTEGSPNALLEAMAAGLPIISTSVGGVPEIATHEVSALLTQPARPEALAAAILRLASDEVLARRLAAEGPWIVAAHHTLPAYGRKLISIYRSALEDWRR